MSCSIDQSQALMLMMARKSSSRRRGSILIEFVLVLPIYIFLFGALYLLGDMGLNAIRIAVGDRVLAMDAGDKEGISSKPFLSDQMRDEKSKTSFEFRTYRTDAKFRGAWSWQAAGKTSFTYTLPSYGGGLIAYPYLLYGDSSSNDGFFKTLVNGKTIRFHSKDNSLGARQRIYNYYTLKRTDLARDPNAYRNWDSRGSTSRSRLMDSGGTYWYNYVYKEDYADPVADNLDKSHQAGRGDKPRTPSGRKEYNRFGTFVTWSQ